MSDSSPRIYENTTPRPELAERVKRFLVPQERLVMVQRHHVAAIISQIAIFIAIALLAMGIDVFSAPEAGQLRDGAWTVTGLAFLYMSWYLLNWNGDLLIVTNKRLMHTRGVLTKSVVVVDLKKVNDMRIEESVAGRIFGYGRFNAEAVGGTPLGKGGLDFIPHVQETWMEISNLLHGPGAKSEKEPQEVRLVGAILPDLHGEPVEIVLPPATVKSAAGDDRVHPVNAAMVPVWTFRDDKGELRSVETDVTTSGNKRRRIRFLR